MNKIAFLTGYSYQNATENRGLTARGGCRVGLRPFDDAGGDEFGKQVIDVNLTEVVLCWGYLGGCGETKSYFVKTHYEMLFMMLYHPVQ